VRNDISHVRISIEILKMMVWS